MFCIYCGKEIPEGGTCSCRQTAPQNQQSVNDSNQQSNTGSYQQPNTGSYQQPNYGQDQNQYYSFTYQRTTVTPTTQSAYTNEAVESPAYNIVARELASPMFLVFAILYSAAYVLNLCSTFTLNILGVLTIIASWITFAAARKYIKTGKQISTSGLTMYSGVLITGIVFLCIGFALITIALIISIVLICNYTTSSGSHNVYLSLPIILIIYAFLLCIFLFFLFYLIKLRNNVTHVRSIIRNEKPAKKISLFPSVIMFIGAIMSVISVITTLLTTSLINSLLQEYLVDVYQYFEEYNIPYKFNFAPNYISLLAILISAASTVVLGIFFIKLKSSLSKEK